MATLNNVDGRTLVPDLSQSLGLLFNGVTEAETRKRTEAKENRVDNLIGQLGSGEGDTNEIMAGLAQIDPQLVTQVKPIFERRNQQELADTKSLVEKKKARALSVLREEDDAGQIRVITSIVNQMQAEGAPQAEIAQAVALANLPVEQRTAKLESDLLKGKVLNTEIDKYLNPQETFETIRDDSGRIVAQQSSKTKKFSEHPLGVETDDQLQQKIKVATAGKSETIIRNEIRNAGGKKEAEELAKLRAGRFREFQDQALAAEEQNAGLSQLQNIDIETGFGEGVKSQAARVFNAFGVNGDELLGTNVAGAQAYNAVAGKLVLDVMSNQKGPQTDKDQERIAKTLPNIGNEQLANRFNINALVALNDRKIEMAAFYENYLEENETLRGADKEWSKFKRETPMLSDNVTDPNTGLPMFFNEFKKKARESNPSASDEQIIKKWRELANGK